MNAKWLEKFSEYRKTENAYEISRIILNEKITRQGHVFSRKFSSLHIPECIPPERFFLYEARAARKYWYIWRREFGQKYGFPGRKIHGSDPVNKLLDVGYHFLTGYIFTFCKQLDIPTELGILHRASSKKSNPLVYDVIEWLRPIVVDETIIHLLRKKKTPFRTESEIGKILSRCKKKLTAYYFHNGRHNCITLEYWIQLTLLEFRGAVSENRRARFTFPPMRHDMRCSVPNNLLKIKKPKELPRAFRGQKVHALQPVC